MGRYIKLTVSVLVLTVMALCMGMTVFAETDETRSPAAPVPLEITDGVTLYDYLVINDDVDETFFTLLSDCQLRITGESPFASVYIKFEEPCHWTLTLPDGTVKQGGKNGFVHEWMALGQAVDAVELSLKEGTCITDIYAFTDGKLPEWVQVWEPPCEKADLLVMPTHADDEHLWFGGTLPYYAGELGYDVQVAYMTNHSNNTIRFHELLNGLWTVGVTHYPVFSPFTDYMKSRDSKYLAELVWGGYDTVLEYQVDVLRRFSPRVVVGHSLTGEYGHGAHMLNAATLLDALELTNDPTAFPESAQKYGTCQVQKCYLHLYEEHPIVVQWSDKTLKRFGGRTALEMASEGFACHISQGHYWSVREESRFDCRQFGLAYTTVGYDTEGLNDMFEHVDWSDKIPEEPDEPPVSASDTVSASDGGAWNALTLAGYIPVVCIVAGVVALAAIVIVLWVKRRA